MYVDSFDSPKTHNILYTQTEKYKLCSKRTWNTHYRHLQFQNFKGWHFLWYFLRNSLTRLVYLSACPLFVSCSYKILYVCQDMRSYLVCVYFTFHLRLQETYSPKTLHSFLIRNCFITPHIMMLCDRLPLKRCRKIEIYIKIIKYSPFIIYW